MAQAPVVDADPFTGILFKLRLGIVDLHHGLTAHALVFAQYRAGYVEQILLEASEHLPALNTVFQHGRLLGQHAYAADVRPDVHTQQAFRDALGAQQRAQKKLKVFNQVTNRSVR